MADKFTRLAKNMPSLYKAEVNTMIRGLLKAWGLGDDNVEVQIANAKDQLYVMTAGGRYLDFLANNFGVSRSPELGIEDPDFRKLTPVLSTFPKQVRKTIIALLDVFWGPGFTRPNINSGNIEPFNFGPVSVLTGNLIFSKGSKEVKGTGTQFLTEVAIGDYIKPTSRSGKEYVKVAGVIDDENLILSEAWNFDVAVNVSASLANVLTLDYEVDSGRDRREIRFKPNAFADITAASAQELADFINSQQEHNDKITASIFLDPLAGNRLNIRTNTPGLQGSVKVYGGTANSVGILNFALDIARDTKCTVYEINPNEIVIKVPSSVPVLRRNLQGSSHPRQTKAEIFSVNEVFNFASLGATSTLTLTVDGSPYTVNFNHSTNFEDPTSVRSAEVVDVINAQLMFLEAFDTSPASEKAVGLRTTTGSMEYQITGGTANTLLQFPTTLQEDPDLIQSNFPSAYIFDPVGQLFTVTGVNTELSSQIEAGTVTDTIALDNASSFPNKPGKFLINFGRSGQEGPITYNSRPNNSTLLIDASYVFKNEHASGRKVNFISDKPTIPRLTGDDFPVFVVGTEESREAAETLIKKLLAAGIVIRFIVEFPEFLFECVCRDCGPSESASQRGSRTSLAPLVF